MTTTDRNEQEREGRHERVGTSAAERAFFYAGVFLISAAILMLQVVQTRILSVTTWYHLAFFVISMAMFGMTAGAVRVYQLWDRIKEESISYHLERATLFCAATIPISLMAQFTIITDFAASFTTVVSFALLAVCIAVPFYFGGVVVSLALTRSPYPVGNVYSADLLGAGGGCLAALLLLNQVDGPSAVLAVSVLVALSALCFARSGLGKTADRDARGSWLVRRNGTVLVALVLLFVGNVSTDHGVQPIWVKGKAERYDGSLKFVKWNSFSRVAAYRTRSGTPSLWGPSKKLPDDLEVEQMKLDIDGLASTVMYRFGDHIRETRFLHYDVTNLAYALPGRRKAGAVIGVGGGRDVLSAWSVDMEHVTGVEINPILVGLHSKDSPVGNFSGLADLPNVELVADEARSWFARTDRKFDVIQMSLIDTWAATGAGAFTLSENGLYTREAWNIFLQRLSDQGVYTVSRWFAPGDANETGRMVSLAVASLMDLGAAQPRQHIFVGAAEHIATLVLSRSPLRTEDVAALRAAVQRNGFDVLVSPDARAATDVLERIVSRTDLQELHTYTSSMALDLTAPTDDRPFFFNQLKLDRPGELLRAIRGGNKGVLTGNILATATLVIILLVSVLLVVVTIVLPLRSSVRHISRHLATGGSTYFLLIGIGFMMVEIGLLQRSSVFLGHPSYSLSVVLFSIIVATGIGSLVSERLKLDSRAKVTVWAVLTAAYVGSLPSWMPGLFLQFDDAALMTRAALAVGVIAPAGLLMGFGFPTGMRLVSAVDERVTPWFWGVNGAAGVLAGGMAILLGMTFGIGVTLRIGAVCYIGLIPAAAWIAMAGERKSDPPARAGTNPQTQS